MILIFFIGIPFLFGGIILIAFFMMQKKKSKSQSAVLQKMQRDASAKSGGMDVFYQKVYLKIERIPLINRYLRKIRRRLELVNVDDEYTIRRDTGKITLRSIIIALVAAIIVAYINRDNLVIMLVSLLGLVIVIENLTEQMINKVENKLLEQELEFFSEVRHAYHTSNMVEEAIYDASLMDEQEIVSQANAIYDILISADPEMELEKYYDVAPNRFLKIFAGVSYLTREFGDRKVGGVSLFLKDMNNITQELQLEILKRDKLDYLFKSLTYIAVAPIVLIKPLKNWALENFASTAKFYEGSGGFLAEIILIVTIFLAYSLIVRIKDNEEKIQKYSSEGTWQDRVYRLPVVERLIDGLVPNRESAAYAKITKLLKDTASPLKIEWFYVNRAVSAVLAFCVSLFIAIQMNNIAVNNVLFSDTSSATNIMGKMSDKELQEARSLTASDRFYVTNLMDSKEIVNIVRNKPKEEALTAIERQLVVLSEMELTDEKAEELAEKVFRNMSKPSYRMIGPRLAAGIQDAILKSGIEMPKNNFAVELSKIIIDHAKENDRKEVIKEDVIEGLKQIYVVKLDPTEVITMAERIYDKINDLMNSSFSWIELAVSILVALIAYQVPKFFLLFQKKMRQMDMDDEVMQFQTIILMLMHIERVSVEYILEWITRFSSIFREPLQRCMNNYESGGYEALEQLKDEVTFKPFIRIVESLQSAVENVKITDAFDELESERAFFQEKRKESNERLIQKKAKIGKAIGFTPMIGLFVGYLIVPLIMTSMVDMGSYFTQMGSML